MLGLKLNGVSKRGPWHPSKQSYQGPSHSFIDAFLCVYIILYLQADRVAASAIVLVAAIFAASAFLWSSIIAGNCCQSSPATVRSYSETCL